MKNPLKHIALKLFLIVMPLLIINQSIDEIDFQPLVVSSDIGNFNDLNSAVEYVFEVVLGHKDAFPEFQKSGSHKQSASFKHPNAKALQYTAALVPPPVFIIPTNFAYPIDEKYSFLFSKEFIEPPSA